MLFQKKTISGLFLLLLISCFLSGCGSLFKEVKDVPEVDCYTALNNDLTGIEDIDVARLLDKSAGPEDAECWWGLVECSLRQSRNIPRNHLIRSIREFNQQKHEELFHLAVSRYLTDIALGQGVYRKEERALLQAYVSFLINRSDSSSNSDLRNAQLLCRRLDTELYRRFFE